MKTEITKDLVLAYHTGRVRDPQLRKAIEDAREWDPYVRRWFSLLTDMGEEVPTAIPFGKSKPYRVTIEYVPVLAGDTSASPSPPDVSLPPELPVRRVNPVTKQVELWETPQTIPYGVARVIVELAGKTVGRRLVPFIQDFEGGVEVRKAALWLSEIGIPAQEVSKAEFHVIPADDDNLGEFPLVEVENLAKKYPANFAATDAVELLLGRLKQEDQP